MAAVDSLAGLLPTLTDSLNTALSSFPPATDSMFSQPEGISLLDTKNDLLLSYLQNLVFLIIIRLRHASIQHTVQDETRTINHEVTANLIELRVYLEKGVRPLESRLKYQIERVLRTADDAERSGRQRQKGVKARNGRLRDAKRVVIGGSSDFSNPDSDSDSAASKSTASSGDEAVAQLKPKIDDLSYRPNPSAMRLHNPDSSRPAARSISASGAYKPPRITPTSMFDAPTADKISRNESRAHRSRLLDEYVSTELSTAPHAEPSIGSNATIMNRGRGSLSTREREKERERREWEEGNFARLPQESKAEKKKSKRRGPDRSDGYGGEDWTGLGEVGDRVARSVGRGRSARSERESVLERREKRRRDAGDIGPGGGSHRAGMGESFEKRRRILESRAKRKGKGVSL